MEFDHADIYPDLAAVEGAFSSFLWIIPDHGRLVACGDDPGVLGLLGHARCRVELYGLGPEATTRALQVDDHAGGGCEFTLLRDGMDHGRFRTPLSGEHNLQNTIAALAVALGLGVEPESLRESLPGFLGVHKRLEVVGEEAGVLVVDDFAHHPTAVRATIAAARLRWPGRRLWAVFEAKSNTSRRRVFQQAYVEALALADMVVVSRPYRKKDNLKQEERLDVSRLVREVSAAGPEARLIPEVDEIAAFIAGRGAPGDLVLGLSGSAFGGLHRKVLEKLRGLSRSHPLAGNA